MSTLTGLPLAVSIVELIGSISSFLGASFILACYIILPVKKHFRHTLILNLATADAINGLCNTLSGIIVLIHRQNLKSSAGCIANGFIGQLTVQGTDTAIFSITCVTIYVITSRAAVQPQWSWPAVILTWASVWVLPLITSFTALGMNWYGPVSGNWCWLIATPIYIRYVLTHGWRFLFIFLEVGLYIYLHKHLKRRGHFTNLGARRHASDPEAARPQVYKLSVPKIFKTKDENKSGINPPELWNSNTSTHVSIHSTDDLGDTSTYWKTQSPRPPLVGSHNISNIRIMGHRQEGHAISGSPRFTAVERVLLLNAYPLLYIILWLPGLANRLVEASGHTSKVTQVMQLSTQFVGFANALTFGWNEEVARQMAKKFGRV